MQSARIGRRLKESATERLEIFLMRPDLQAEADADSGHAQLDLGDAAGQEHDGQAAQHARLPHRHRIRYRPLTLRCLVSI